MRLAVEAQAGEPRVVRLTVRCAPWSGTTKPGDHSVHVDLGGGCASRVRVWDPIGKIYTVCHNLSERSQAKIVKRAIEHELTRHNGGACDCL